MKTEHQSGDGVEGKRRVDLLYLTEAAKELVFEVSEALAHRGRNPVKIKMPHQLQGL